MKKLSKIKLHDAVELEDHEMKMIFGGSGATLTCLLKCGSSKETWFWSANCDPVGIQRTCDYYGYGGPISCTCP